MSKETTTADTRHPIPDTRHLLRSVRYQRDARWLLLAGWLPPTAFALWIGWRSGFSMTGLVTLGITLGMLWLVLSVILENRLIRPVQTLANVIKAFREGDYSVRALGENPEDALGILHAEVNALGGQLREQRLTALEATAILRTIMQEIDVAVFAFDQNGEVQFSNRAAALLVGQTPERMLGASAVELGLDAYLNRDATVTEDASFRNGAGRWRFGVSNFRQNGRPHRLLVVSDLSRELRAEERLAWQRLIRVISHEMNNSLTPIKSIAESLDRLLSVEHPPDDWREDMHRGLDIIAGRSDGLARFMASYARLARLPDPNRRPIELKTFIERVARLETRLNVEISPGRDLVIDIDPDQIEQALINLLRNAAEASLETGGGVRMEWETMADRVEIRVLDSGHGIANPSNLFVPFFTTKPSGSGIGLILSRQIIEAHNGRLTLDNRPEGGGAAKIVLPIQSEP